VSGEPDSLIDKMSSCNEERKKIQAEIVAQARLEAVKAGDAPVLFLGGDWHPGVVGIAASKIVEEFWRPTWLFQRKDGICKGSARGIPDFDVTQAMTACGELFTKFGGHAAAGGFTFPEENEGAIRAALEAAASELRKRRPELWLSRIEFDCTLPGELATLELAEAIAALRPFGHGFAEPKFLLEADIFEARLLADKNSGKPRHTAVLVRTAPGRHPQKIMFFNDVRPELLKARRARFVVSAGKNTWRGETLLALTGHDVDLEKDLVLMQAPLPRETTGARFQAHLS